MKAYLYNAITKEYISEVDRQLDQLETQKNKIDTYLMPANTTDISPPDSVSGKARVFDGSKWIQKTDKRGETYYDKATCEAVVVSDIGTLPSSLTSKIPASNYDEWIDSEWIKNEATELADLKSIKENEIKSQIMNRIVEADSEYITKKEAIDNATTAAEVDSI